MRYIIRSLKYLVLISVLYIALMWLTSITTYTDSMDVWTLLRTKLTSDQGVWLIAAFVGLAIFYPRFGFMRSKIDGCDIKNDRIRIDNAMHVYGYKYIEERGDVIIYRAESFIKRLTLMFEDEIEVRKVDGGIEIAGIRRSAARIIYQLRAYMDNSRFDN